MLLKDLITGGTGIISRAYPEKEAREMVFLFLEYHIGTSRHTHMLNPSYEVAEDAALQAVEAFERMASGEPVQYVAGKAFFYGRDFNVTPDVLIPRPETELLVREALEWAKGGGRAVRRIADLCTGSGCIAWTMAHEIPGSEVVAVDISDGALSVASRQPFLDCACPRFVKANVLDSPPAGLGMFDMVLSNPPYVMESEKALMRRNVLEHEPALALFVPDEDPLLFYRAVASWAASMLVVGGLCLVEINESLGAETADVFIRAGFRDVEVLKDLASRDRFVRAIR